MLDGMNARKAETVETVQFECVNSTNQFINKYDKNGEEFICEKLVHTSLIAHAARIGRLGRLLCVAMATWSAQTISTARTM